ncbi:glycosyl transferase [Lyngbya confervoides]|uniref:Glycosyl transferase n=1 Tax=Lyngbya confervoides BDU141951 TaxID=1574623 RepID=A0ABD4T7V6_9CYAN|nr:glycosyl transferase [Lyngbya confervoides]MCM1984340.1 glycosyl transferase [Lyngbya confervoides BDU141951]
MTRPVLYAAITNHGFGHATRSAAVLADLQRACPDLRLILVTTAPKWLLDSYLVNDYLYRPQRLDIGAVQQDSLTIDRAATLEALQALRSQQADLIATEVACIQEQGAILVYGDIPPLAARIAAAAGVPCWMSSNFGWDLIYQDWGKPFVEMVNWVREGFSLCDRLFRMPFHEPMSAFPNIEDIGLTGALPRYSRSELQAKVPRWIEGTPTVMLTFGGYGLSQVPYANVLKFPDWQFITFDSQAPTDLPNLIKVSGHQVRPVDLMPLCDRIISKPGYGTFAEALMQDLPIVTVPRTGFAEARYLVKGLQNHGHHLCLEPGEFETSTWDFLNRPLHPPQAPGPLDKTGNHTLVEAFMRLLGDRGAAPATSEWPH